MDNRYRTGGCQNLNELRPITVSSGTTRYIFRQFSELNLFRVFLTWLTSLLSSYMSGFDCRIGHARLIFGGPSLQQNVFLACGPCKSVRHKTAGFSYLMQLMPFRSKLRPDLLGPALYIRHDMTCISSTTPGLLGYTWTTSSSCRKITPTNVHLG